MATNEDPAAPTSDKQENSAKEQSATKSSANDKFAIEKDDQQHLTDFQRQKAKYFFHVNLDIENKEYVTWEDVEFYLLFHVTAAGKEGANEGDLEARLSRAARAFWEHVHQQIPLEDGNGEKLTLNQFLDAWASLVDYVLRTNELPPAVQDLVQLAFELYSTDSADGKAPTIQPQAFDQLFQKMNLSRPFAIMAYKYLTDNGTKPLDAEKIDSIVKAVITSSDDEHQSHFLLPGFFKTISSPKEEEKAPPSSPPAAEKEESKSNGKSSPPKEKSPSPPPPTKAEEPPKPTEPEKPSSPESKPVQNGVHPLTTQEQKQPSPPATSPPPPPAKLQKPSIQQEDENIRRLLHYYHIDDGDIVEVAGGSIQRLVLLHPERPLPPYIQQNKQLLQKLQQDSANLFSTPTQADKPPAEAKPRVTLDERVSQGEAQKGPSIPSKNPDQSSPPANVRQVYPELSPAEQQEQQRHAKLQATRPEKEEPSVAHEASTASKKDETKQSKEITAQDEEKIIAAVMKQLTPIVEKRVAAELRRLHSDTTDKDEDEDMVPFPFMLGGGYPFFPGPPPNRANQDQPQQTNGAHGADFGGIPPGAGLFPPPHLLMAMMNDLARGEMAPPSNGPGGAGGFMMFVDDDQLYNGGPGSRSGPRY